MIYSVLQVYYECIREILTAVVMIPVDDRTNKACNS